VMPCQRFLGQPERRLGHVRTPALSGARAAYVHLSARDILGCDACFANKVCGGGCRVVAMLESGPDLNGKHPNHCLLMRAHAQVVERIYTELASEAAFWRVLRHGRSLGEMLAELAANGG